MICNAKVILTNFNLHCLIYQQRPSVVTNKRIPYWSKLAQSIFHTQSPVRAGWTFSFIITSSAVQLSVIITDWRSWVHNTTRHTISTSNPSCGPVNARCTILFDIVTNINYRYDIQFKILVFVCPWVVL